eukprot:7778469-Alexandrium_andersonii.AAC.1
MPHLQTARVGQSRPPPLFRRASRVARTAGHSAPVAGARRAQLPKEMRSRPAAYQSWDPV